MWLLSDYSKRVLLIILVYSLYSTFSSVIGQKLSGVGGVFGLGRRVVIPCLHAYGIILLAYAVEYISQSRCRYKLGQCFSIFQEILKVFGAVVCLELIAFLRFLILKSRILIGVCGVESASRNSSMFVLKGISILNTLVQALCKVSLIFSLFVMILSLSKRHDIWLLL